MFCGSVARFVRFYLSRNSSSTWIWCLKLKDLFKLATLHPPPSFCARQYRYSWLCGSKALNSASDFWNASSVNTRWSSRGDKFSKSVHVICASQRALQIRRRRRREEEELQSKSSPIFPPTQHPAGIRGIYRETKNTRANRVHEMVESGTAQWQVTWVRLELANVTTLRGNFFLQIFI